jgi:eukaryotic-like serine/threonine-protein kinase
MPIDGDRVEAPGNGDSPDPSVTHPERVGAYRILQVIGEGGMGIVYEAEQTEPVRRRVALKIIKQGMDTPVVVARFEAERQALAVRDHPNIATVSTREPPVKAGRTSRWKSCAACL